MREEATTGSGREEERTRCSGVTIDIIVQQPCPFL